ncbi:MAG: TIGR04282 family arsenosugar biosynthesis glycosyltransferase [Desulfobacteraceae bacterium]|nr:TIGR04282 family arsenosugar biosynthesis glycosyltransferase [Desulfobacteraceae bacterium]
MRPPVPGRVKTRLARDLGDEAACDLYRAMVADCIANVRGAGFPLFLFHDGPDAGGLPPEWRAAADRTFSQEGDSLGERMDAAFQRSFASGAKGVILTGSDIPGIDAGLLHSAQGAMNEHDVVFSPAHDGGYCLVASRNCRYHNGMFQGIPWSTSAVLETTIAVCSAQGLSYDLLEPRQDIDTMNDLADYCRRPSGSAPTTNAWLVARGLLDPLRG